MYGFRVRGPLLFTYLCHKEDYTEGDVSNYMSQLMSALAWLHEKEVAHLDVKVKYKVKFCYIKTSNL